MGHSLITLLKRRMALAMKGAQLVHMSHINAREEPEVAFLKGGSRFLATKYQGELAVRAEFPEATIFRCSDVYGESDSFINYWFSKWRKPKATGPYISFWKGRADNETAHLPL